MVERGEGHIINVASLSGLVLLPFHIAYTTTKFGLNGFSAALWAEVRRHGVNVSIVCPGAVSTNIGAATRVHATEAQQKSTERFTRMLEERGMDPEEAGRLILQAVAKEKFLILLGWEAYLLYYLTRLFPSFMRRVVAWITEAVSRGS
jgi:short-subunit dehydrogenase